MWHWDIATGRIKPWNDVFARVYHFKVSPDGTLAALTNELAELYVLSTTNNHIISHRKLSDRLTNLSFSHDSRILLLTDTNEVLQTFDISQGTFTQEFRGHTGGDFRVMNSFWGLRNEFVMGGNHGEIPHPKLEFKPIKGTV